MPQRNYGEKLPEVLSPEWLNETMDGIEQDAKNWLSQMGPEDAARHAEKIKKLIQPYLKSDSEIK